MRKGLYAASAFIGAGLFIAAGASGAQAAPMSVDRLVAAHDFNLMQDVQYFYGGRRYCFYPNGWRGPGFYWCGYNLRRGYGWGGPMGWRGWGGGPAPRFYNQPRRPEVRREHRREHRRDHH